MTSKQCNNTPFPWKNKRIYVAGHQGLVGSAICQQLRDHGACQIIKRTSQELDLRDAVGVRDFFQQTRPEVVILAAARVGGIGANAAYPVDFLQDNLLITNHVIRASYEGGVERLINLGSSCIYPKHAPIPIREECLMTGSLEPTNAPYALAKICGIALCRAYNQQYGTHYLSLMPTNLYGHADTFDREKSHVLPALLLKFYQAHLARQKSVTLWGSGTPLREFLHAEDLARAVLCMLKLSDNQWNSWDLLNVGSGEEVSIRQLACIIQKTVGFQGKVLWDGTKPDGTMRKLLDSSRIRSLGWSPKHTLEDGVRNLYQTHEVFS